EFKWNVAGVVQTNSALGFPILEKMRSPAIVSMPRLLTPFLAIRMLESASMSDMVMVPKSVTPRRRRFQRGSLQKRQSSRGWNWIAFWWEDGRRRGQLLGPCSRMSRPEALAEMGKRLQSINAHAGEVRPRPLQARGLDSGGVPALQPSQVEALHRLHHRR